MNIAQHQCQTKYQRAQIRQPERNVPRHNDLAELRNELIATLLDGIVLHGMQVCLSLVLEVARRNPRSTLWASHSHGSPACLMCGAAGVCPEGTDFRSIGACAMTGANVSSERRDSEAWPRQEVAARRDAFTAALICPSLSTSTL